MTFYTSTLPGDPGVRWRERGEAARRPPPGPAQISQHAGAEEEVQAGPLLQSQVGHDALMAGRDRKSVGGDKSSHGNKKDSSVMESWRNMASTSKTDDF